MNFLLVFLILNFFIFLFKDKINFFSLFDKKKINREKYLKINLIGGNILVINIIFFLIYSYLFDQSFFDQNFVSRRQYIPFFLSVIGIFFLGCIDDRSNLNPTSKTICLILAITLTILGDEDLLLTQIKLTFITIHLGEYSYIFTLFCFLALINAVNMFDGVNLQLSLYTLLILIFFLLNNFLVPLTIILILALTLILFLNFINFLFLGNSGSHLLGFILSYFFIKFYNININKIYAQEIILFMILPGLDMIRVSIYRVLKGNNPFKKDSFHLHHLIKNKFGENISILINFFLICLPIYLFYFLKVNLNTIIILMFIIYLIIFYYFVKYKIK